MKRFEKAFGGDSLFRGLLESAPDAIVIVDDAGSILLVNSQTEKIFLYQREELLGKPVEILVPGRLRAGHPGHRRNYFADPHTREIGAGLDLYGLRKNGEEFPVEISLSPLNTEEGLLVISSIRDVTERKRAERDLQEKTLELELARHAQQRADELEHEIIVRRQTESALRHERDRAQRYLDTAEVIILALDIDGRITLVNRFACAILGWTEEELLGQDFIETCLPASIRRTLRQRLSQLHAGYDAVVENPIVTKTGEERLIEWRNTVLRDGHGRVIGTLSSGADVTARHQAVEALRTAEERTQFALQSAGVGIWEMNYTTGVLRWSEILEAQYGVAPGTFPGTFEAFVERVHPDDRALLLETVAKATASGDDFSVQNRTIWPDGSVHWLSGAGRIVSGDNGKPLRGVGISLDVTERHMLEQQYQQAQKMEAVGRLAGGIAHDFNNLLSAILGYSEMLLDDLGPDSAGRDDVAQIQKAATSATSLTRQLLAFSRKQIVEPTLIDMNAVAAEMEDMLTRLLGEDVTVTLALAPDLAPILADRGQLEQIIMNLSVNARDAMPAGGAVTIETALVELDENYPKTHVAVKPGPYVTLSVTDTGTGLSPEARAHLFEPFFTTKELGKGTGLGLATVYGIVTQYDGHVGVYSEPGKGTSFNLYFPKAHGAVSAEAARPARAVVTGSETILVVEDMSGLRTLTQRMLERLGYTVLVAANGDEALQWFEQKAPIDVLLTDVVMPGLSGPKLTERLAGIRPDLKVIYMSGYTDETIVRHGILEPGIVFLHKPFSSDALGRKIREVLDR